MTTMPLGRTSISVSPVIMGTWQAGRQYWVGIDDEQMIQAIQAALGAGITAFDTAEEYGSGHSERVLGKALGRRRNEAVVMSKVFSNHLRSDDVIRACERSLSNLRTDYIDLYQIHWPSGSWGSDRVPLEETMGALSRLKQAGKIRAIGVSNFSRQQIEEALALGEIASVQPPYSLFWRYVEKHLLPWCTQHDVSVLAYSPLAQGILTGRFGPDHRFEKGDHRSANKLYQRRYWPQVQAALGELKDIAASLEVSMSQLALAWLIRQPQTFAIAGARNAEQVLENARVMEMAIDEEVMTRIGEIGAEVSHDFMDDPVPWTWNP